MPLTLALLWLAFLIQHTVMSHGRLRAAMIARLGLWPFRGVYSLASMIPFGPLVYLWWTHRGEGAHLWTLPKPPAEILALVGFTLVVGAMARPAPSAAYTTVRGDRIDPVGMSAVSRHPMFVGLSMWAIGHLLANGNVVDVVFWGGFPIYTLVGVLHQDARKRAEDPRYADFMRRTSILPLLRPGNLRFVGGRASVGALVGLALGVFLRMMHPIWFH